jgi:indole-3-glycerol phosphate synthase
MDLLEQILQDKRGEIARVKAVRPLSEVQKRVHDVPKPISFCRALTSGGFGIIAEIKKKSPSMGEMNPADVAQAPEVYKESAVVKAVSILTDSAYFGMGIEDLEPLKRQIGKPVLRKDFIFDEYQVFEARAAGADAILLMASVLDRGPLQRLFDLATELGMDVLFECHSGEEIDAIPERAKIVGINSRKFKTSGSSFRYRASRLLGKFKSFGLVGMRDFSTDLDLFKELVGHLPKAAVKVAESGLKPSAIGEVRRVGFDCALIGTALLKSPLGIRRTLDLFSQALQENALTTREPTGQLS